MKTYEKYLKKGRRMDEVAKKGDHVYFYNDAGEKVLGLVLSVNGNIYTIEYDGDQYQTNDVMNEMYNSYVSISSSLTNPPDNDAEKRTAASVAGDDKDIANRVKKITDKLGGDSEGAAKEAAKMYLRYGKPFAYALSKAVDNGFMSMFNKAIEDFKAAELEKKELDAAKAKEKEKSKGKDETA